MSKSNFRVKINPVQSQNTATGFSESYQIDIPITKMDTQIGKFEPVEIKVER